MFKRKGENSMSTMSFDDFKDVVVDKILEYLPDCFEGAEVALNDVSKPNDVKLTGLVIRKADCNIAPSIYLEDFYDQIEYGVDIEEVLRRIARVRMAHEIDKVDFESFLDYESCKDKIYPRLYGYELNTDLVESRAHTRLDDFVVMYVIDMGEVIDGRMTIPVEQTILEKWEVSVEDIHQVALKNQHELHDGVFTGMADMLKKLFYQGMDEDVDDEFIGDVFVPELDGKMYIISNERILNGASMILDKEFMDDICDTIGDGFIVLPSSIHELIVLPDDGSMSLDYMAEMVYTVNRSQVKNDDMLSDHVYRYSRENGLVRAA